MKPHLGPNERGFIIPLGDKCIDESNDGNRKYLHEKARGSTSKFILTSLFSSNSLNHCSLKELSQ